MFGESVHDHQYIIFELGSATDIEPSLDLEFDSYTVKQLTGIALSQRGLIASDFSMTDIKYPPVSQLADSMGEWAAVGEKKTPTGREFIVFADTFGYLPLFYSYLSERRFVVSDSFHGVAAAMDREGAVRTLNLANYVTTLSSSMSYFQNIFSDETMLEEVRVLRPDQFIHVGQFNGVSFHDRSELGESKKLRTYTHGIHAGLELSASVISAIDEIDNVDKRITLSGGVDSRAVLAQLAATGQHRDYGVYSVDPRTWPNKVTAKTIERDIEISNQIRSDLGMHWWQPRERTSFDTSFLLSLRGFQSYRSNLYYSSRLSKSVTVQDRLTATLRGGGGEIISGTSGARSLVERWQTNGTDREPFDWASRHYTNSPALLKDFRDLSINYVKSVLERYKLGNFEESLNNHYFQTRNRAHFGHLRHSLVGRELTVHMLSNSYFYHASRLVPFGSRAEGKIMEDIFTETEPGLLRYIFENDEWTNYLSKTTLKGPPYGSWRESYDQAKAEVGRIKHYGQTKPRIRSKNEAYHFDRVAENYLKFAFSVLEDLAPVAYRKLLSEQHSRVFARIAQGQSALYNAVLKATSALDGFFPQVAHGAKLTRRCENTQGPDPQRFSEILERAVPSCDLVELDVPIFEQNPELVQTPEGFRIETNFKAEDVTGYQFAYYLIKDGQRVGEIWYQSDTVIDFERKVDSGKYHGIAHVRYKGSSIPTYYQKTNVIEIE